MNLLHDGSGGITLCIRLLERALQVNYKEQELKEEKSGIQSGTKTTAKRKQPRQMQGRNKTAVTQTSWPYLTIFENRKPARKNTQQSGTAR